MTLHVYARPAQPLVRYVDFTLVGMGWTRRRATFRTPPRVMRQCRKCGRRRWAKNLSVRVYCDMTDVFCTEGCRP